MKEAALSKDFGTMISADEGQALKDIPSSHALDCVRKNGVLLLRGFAGMLPEFEQFTQTIAARFIHNGNDSREILGDEGRSRSVTPGQNFIGPHSEFSYTPFRPDLLFFYCIRPAASGGASLLWDGRKLWDEMPEHLQTIFLNKRISYKYAGIDLHSFGQFGGCKGEQEICAFLDGLPNFSYKRNGDKVDMEYGLTAYVQNLSDGSLAFSNSIAVLEKTMMEDGSPLTPLDCAELLDLALRNTLTIDTLPGDVIVIDNWRVMHGRTAFEDTKRQMCVRMGYGDEKTQPRFSADFEEIEY